MEHNKPRLFYIKIQKAHQGANKIRIVTTHDPRIMPKYFKDRHWEFSRAYKRA